MAEVVGEALTQLGELAIGVPVDGEHGRSEGFDDVAGDRLGNRVGVLVDVEGDPHRFLRSTVGVLAPQVVADGQVVELE